MLTIAAGHDIRYLTDQVAVGREAYYLDAVEAGEPPGTWWGAGAEALGLRGEVDATVMEAVYARHIDPRDPAAADRTRWDDAERFAAGHKRYQDAEEIYARLLEKHPHAGPEERDLLRAEAARSARSAVGFLDATFSAPKSVSVLAVAFERAAVEAEIDGDLEAAAAWRRHHQAVEAAVLAGGEAALEHLQDVAGYARVGKHGAGAGRWQASHEFVVARFLQHDSRDKDPQLHVHQAILNRQRCADGKWRSLDGVAVHQERAAAAAIGERVMEAWLARTLGVVIETRPDGKAREIVGVPQKLLELFSSRRREIEPKAAGFIEEFERVVGRAPNLAERNRLWQEATLATRSGKSDGGETLDARLRRWERETRTAVEGGLSSVASAVLAQRQDAGPAAAWAPEDVIARAIEQVKQRDSAWTRSDLMRAVSDALPGQLGLEPERVRELLEGLTDQAQARAVRLTAAPDLSLRPAALLRDDGGDAYARRNSERYAAPGQVQAERALREAAVERGAHRCSEATARAWIERAADSGLRLGDDQTAAVVGVCTSGARVEVLQAAAGTGKSVVVGVLAQVWEQEGRRVFGLAPSQVAADVLADEGVDAANVDRWLGAHRRIAAGRAMAGDDAMRVRDGDVVVVDEAGMASTTQLAEVREVCARVGAKLLLVGDPQQLGSVGPGGGLADLAERAVRYELIEVRRFSEAWERRASLALRDGDPDALAEYDRHGRILDAGDQETAEHAALEAWMADTLQGREALLLVGDNEAAARVSAAARAELVRLGRLEEGGTPLRDGTVAGVGDLVQARRNGWELVEVDGQTQRAPINRAAYRVVEAREDGGLVVTPAGGEDGAVVRLPADYVARNVTLGYASTVHAAQGRTVDTAHAVIGSGWTSALAYVGLTRGRDGNHAWMVSERTPEDSPPGLAEVVHPRSGVAVLADVLGRDASQRAALAEQAASEQEAASELTVVGQLADAVAQSTAGRTRALLDQLAADGVITESQRIALGDDEAMSAVDRALRAGELAGRDRAAVLDEALAGRSLTGARSPGQVLHHRVASVLGDTGRPLTTFADLTPADVGAEWRPFLAERVASADARRHELGEAVAADPPVWALEALGPVPADVVERAEWERRAGWAAVSREMSGHASETDPLGTAPPAGLAEAYAVWRTAHHELGLVDRGPAEGEMTEGQLRARVAAYEREKAWAPAAVRAHLGATERAADAAGRTAMLGGARGDAAAGAAGERESVLRTQAGQLDEADRARQAWHEHTAETRANADRARAELDARGVDVEAGERVTAEDWLAAHRAEQAVEDEHRDVDALADDEPLTQSQGFAAAGPETAVPDVRDTSRRDLYEDTDRPDRLLTIDETAAAVERAQEALRELRNRDTVTEQPADEPARPDEDEQDAALEDVLEG